MSVTCRKRFIAPQINGGLTQGKRSFRSKEKRYYIIRPFDPLESLINEWLKLLKHSSSTRVKYIFKVFKQIIISKSIRLFEIEEISQYDKTNFTSRNYIR